MLLVIGSGGVGRGQGGIGRGGKVGNGGCGQGWSIQRNWNECGGN